MNITNDDELRSAVLKRDKVCQMWKALTDQERSHIHCNYFDEFSWTSKKLTVAHIIPRSKNKKLKYEMDNVVLISLYFHKLLDSYLHPVTRKKITKEERMDFYHKAKLCQTH